MHLDDIDGELHILDENYEIVHVFERSSSNSPPDGPILSRAAYKHMCGWVKTNWKAGDDPDETWVKAEAAWDALDPDAQMYVWTLARQEEQNAQDLCTGLLANLSEYRGLDIVKRAFQTAIKGVLSQFVE
jgi:hypothetical protein